MRKVRAIQGLAIAAACALTGVAGAVSVDQPTSQTKELSEAPEAASLELFGSFGPTVLFGDPANPEYQTSFGRVGMMGEFGLAYRSWYFIDPFLSVSYSGLARGQAVLPEGVWGAGGTLEQKLRAWVISPGITSDIWRFRPRFALGVAVLVQSFEFNGVESSSTQTPLVTQLGLGFNVFDEGRTRLDLEGRGVLISGADVNFVTLDVILRGDLFYFGD